MRRLVTGLIGIGIAVGVAACGQSTATINVSNNGQVIISMVVTGDQSGINSAKQQAQSGGGGATQSSVVDGDQHQGNKVCETDVTQNGDTYHVVVYSTSPAVTPSFCDSTLKGGSSGSSPAGGGSGSTPAGGASTAAPTDTAGGTAASPSPS